MKFQLEKQKLTVQTASGLKREFAFPAASLSIAGKLIQAKTQTGPVKKMKNGGFKSCYSDGGITFEITIEPGKGDYFYKTVVLKTSKKQPTPDFVDVDFQQQKAAGLRKCGYMITNGETVSPNAEEEGGGVVPGCGYPLIGDDLFAGLEHPAAFNEIVSEKKGVTTWRLRHHPIWEGKEIHCIRAVIGMSKQPRESFMEYVAEIRLPALKQFLVSFCSFWSDPYIGNYEYKVDTGNYTSLVKAFSKLGLRPDVYTLDAGWQDRRSFFDAKPDFGGNKALKKLAQTFRDHGSDISLWVSHNGPMGMDWDFLKSRGIAVGAGQSADYCGDHFAVMMDKKLEKALTKRFCELCSPEYGTVHFKIDWDNDSATSPEFQEIYPTRDHVREASINMMSRVGDAMRKVNPKVTMRKGGWPSPWWLCRASHVFLADSGDSEYSSFPSLTQRDAATTHRDSLYYAEFQRDHSAYPLDGIDNHEFPHALRNPFVENPAVWSNTCLWAFMRGASYIPMMLQPESFEKWQAETFRDVMAYARKYAERILTGHSCMIGGAPSKGEIYGFCHPDKNGRILLALRNASPIPQEYAMPKLVPYWTQVYPCCQNFKAGAKLLFAPHEVKIFEGCLKQEKLPAEICQLIPTGKNQYKVVLPASKHPGVAKIYQIPEMKALSMIPHTEKKNAPMLEFGIQVPYKMRNFELSVKINKGSCAKVESVHLYCCRYPGIHDGATWSVPLREIPYNKPNYGELKNPDLTARHDARYFTGEVPQGGICYFNLILNGKAVSLDDVGLYLSGYECPADAIEEKKFKASRDLAVPPVHPYGFPLVLKIK